MNKGLNQAGYVIVHDVLKTSLLNELRISIAPLLDGNPAAGIRGLAQKVPCIQSLSESPVIRDLVEPVLGSSARMTRSALFNKNENTNWQVAWHQDLAVAVQRRTEVEGFRAWSVKDGVTHVQPPVAVLERMLTIRLHLDVTNETNGALWVSPGTHRLGRIPTGEAAAVTERYGKQLCSVRAGDALLFRPLLLHASRKVTSSNPRRVIHLEFAGTTLAEPLVWHEEA